MWVGKDVCDCEGGMCGYVRMCMSEGDMYIRRYVWVSKDVCVYKTVWCVKGCVGMQGCTFVLWGGGGVDVRMCVCVRNVR